MRINYWRGFISENIMSLWRNLQNTKNEEIHPENGFDVEVKYLRVPMKILGVWPPDYRGKRIMFSISSFILTAIVLLTMKTFFIEWKIEAIFEYSKTLIHMFILAKVFLFKFYQREFGEMYESMENNWRQAKYLNSEKKRIMSDDLQQSQKLVKYWALHFSAFLVLVLVLPLLRILILHEPLKLNIDVWDSFHTSPGFELAMVLQTVVELYNCLALISLECSFLITTSHCSAQLKILCHSIEQYDGLITHDNCEEQLNCACIRCVVRRHEEIMKFFGLLRKCFNSAISLNLILAESYLCVFIAMGSKQAEHQSGLYPAICWSFTMIMIVVGFIYCHIGEKITQESLNVSNAFFNCHWYESEASKAKYYVTPMIISRSIPMEITVGIFYKLSHELFKNCIFLAYSVFSLFRTISEKQNAIVK